MGKFQYSEKQRRDRNKSHRKREIGMKRYMKMSRFYSSYG